MKRFLQLLAILTLMVWGGFFLYYYTSGRIEKYLDPSFRTYALVSGVGFLLLGAFNFLNRNRETGVCTHDHAHGEICDHDHHHPEHEHEHDCCGHGHEHGHGGHEHEHEHEHDCCGHEHGHEHGHSQTEAAPHASSHHHHEESVSGVLFSLIVLLVPILVATSYSRDSFSSEYVAKWDKIERQMMQKRIADARASQKTAVAASQPPVANPYTREGIEAAQGATNASVPAPAQADTPPEPKKDAAAEAWGTFTMEDLKKMVPQNDKGEFLLDVPQIFYTAGDEELMGVMEGIPVETTAQLMEETLNNPNKTRLKAFRLFIECCAADARPLSIPVDFGKAPPKYTEMGWYKLYGKLHYAKENDELIPLIRIERIEETAEPTDGLMF